MVDLPPRERDDPSAEIRDDLGRSHQTAAPPLGHLLGLHRVRPTSAEFALSFDTSRPALAGGPSILEVATLADLALGGVIRNRVGLTVPMPTVSITLHMHVNRVDDVVAADAEPITCGGGRMALSRCQLRGATGEVVGGAQAAFQLPELPYNGPGQPMPWDSWGDPQEPRGGLDRAAPALSGPVDLPSEELVGDICDHSIAAPVRAWGTTYLEANQIDAEGDLTVTHPPVMANRRGFVQGAALLTHGVLAMKQDTDFQLENIVTTTVDYISPARLGEPTKAVTKILRSGRRSLFASALLIQGERICCNTSAVFQR